MWERQIYFMGKGRKRRKKSRYGLVWAVGGDASYTCL
jgi:hypothetical protein